MSGQHPAAGETHMADRQKAIARRWYEDVIIDRTLDAIDQIYPPTDDRGHPYQPDRGRQGREDWEVSHHSGIGDEPAADENRT